MKHASLRPVLICGTCSWLMWATPSEARFLQVDPIGYQDQTNLYAYVRNDPVNGMDPTGECQRNTASDGTVTYSGVCPMDANAERQVEAMKQNPASQIGATDAEAIAQNQPIYVREAALDTHSPPQDFVSGRTELKTDGAIVVTINPNEVGLVDGYDASSGAQVRNYSESVEETYEHEIAGEARSVMQNPAGDSRAAAVAAENRYRERRGENFRRVGHTGRERQGPAPRRP